MTEQDHARCRAVVAEGVALLVSLIRANKLDQRQRAAVRDFVINAIAAGLLDRNHPTG